MKASSRRTRRGDFLEKYGASSEYLLRPDKARGAAGILDGFASNGEPVLIRTWVGGAGSDGDLREIWRNELRVLHRLGGSPGAEEHIARLIDAGEDAQGFHIVLSAGQRRPIATLIDKARPGTADWLRITSAAGNRRRLWQNLKRIAIGLEILHSQGLLHCNLDTWSVLSTGGAEPDFQLTGFEWSMRLTGATDRKSRRRGVDDQKPISFLDDWADFARLAAKLLGAKEERLTDLAIPAHEVNENLGADEISFLRELLSPSPLTQIDGEYVSRRIDVIESALEAVAAADEAKHFIVLNLGVDSGLSRAVRDASDLTIETGDIDAQKRFIEADLSDTARILAVGTPENFRLVLRGEQLAYHLREFIIPKASGPTWEFAACDNASLTDSWGGKIASAHSLSPNTLSLMTMSEARERTPRLRGRVLSWDLVRSSLEQDAPSKPSRERRTFQALVLLHAVELALASADVFPVQAAKDVAPSTSEDEFVHLRLRDDPDREFLAKTLDLRPLADRLQSLVERDTISDDEGWLLSDANALGRRASTDVELQFEKCEHHNDVPMFTFRVTSQGLVPPAEGLLVPGDFQGRLAQFRRRARALRGLEAHLELLRMLADPRGRLVDTHEKIDKTDSTLARLDDAKQAALKELIAILPLYLLQGPPGVGKTYLVRDLVRRRLVEEPSARLLLTAQSHYAVDHLMDEIQKDLKQSETEVLAVRCRSAEDREKPGPLDVQAQTEALISRLSKSLLAESTSEPLRHVLNDFTPDVGASKQKPKGSRAERRALNGLVMRAANLVFATTNSADLERLVDERGQFDWTIIEEAGKATGGELIMPLLLSHRRLMIGDHRQLPPFGSVKLSELLADPANLRDALALALEMVERPLKEGITDDLLNLLDDDDGEQPFAELCAEAQRMLFLFETIIEGETKRQARPGASARSIARVLNIQHRMHPAIADLVSECFYDGDLKTDPIAKRSFEESRSPVRCSDAHRLPDTPIVVVDMPYQQATVGKRHVERYPRYSNQEEIDAVVSIVKHLKAEPQTGGKKPTLAILSPYKRQVDLLQSELRDNESVQSVLSGFRPVARGDLWFSTVDAFQGNEADAIIVSFVRNNHHATLRRALGFLSDSRRMNVLLSRAKWRLYIVASLEFIDTVTSPLGLADLPEAKFLKTFLKMINSYQTSGKAVIISPSKLVTP